MTTNAEHIFGQNLTEITWAHAVDSDKYLTEVLNGDINFIEADILLGYMTNDTDKQYELPIMAHPPATTSDLSLEIFLERIQTFNIEADVSKIKGVKLDFKSIAALEKSVNIVNETYDMYKFPTWINADILPGPVNNTATIPVDPVRFFRSVKQLGPVVLSIGWTTKWDKDSVEGSYTETNVNEMINTIKENGIDSANSTITFPIRAGIASNSLNELIHLYCVLKDTNPITFTIWSSAGDAVNVEKLRELIFTIGLDKVYIDVPADLENKLHLNDNPLETKYQNELAVRC